MAKAPVQDEEALIVASRNYDAWGAAGPNRIYMSSEMQRVLKTTAYVPIEGFADLYRRYLVMK